MSNDLHKEILRVYEVIQNTRSAKLKRDYQKYLKKLIQKAQNKG